MTRESRTPPEGAYVVKRDGRKEEVITEKITSRVRKLCYGLDMNYINPNQITAKAASGIYKGVTTVELDNLAAEVAASMTTMHPDYALLAARIAISNLHKETKKAFSDTITDLYKYIDPEDGSHSPMVSEEVFNIVQANKEILNSTIIYDRDFSYTFFGFKTLERSYLMRINGKVVERPQQMLMRVALGIHKQDVQAAIQTYNLMSERWFTHASPTLFNAGTINSQLSSCFLLPSPDDSMEGICKTLTDCALISKSAGGIGFSVHNIRSFGTRIRTTKGTSNGIVPMLRVYNNMSRYVDQGGNKRPGAYAVYLEPWHADVMEFLEMRLNNGCEELRARDLFYALWIPDLFMKRVKEDKHWSLMCPKKSPGLASCWGEKFEELYTKYEREGRFNRQIPAREVWKKIITSQTETGTPYMLYKDACNGKSNHQNLGTITCSNLCTEIVEYTAPDEVAVCNLASISLPRFVVFANGASNFGGCNGNDGNLPRIYDFGRLKEVTKVVTRNLNKIIDVNHYPIREAENSNKRHRPIGIGVQGLADAFLLMRYPFVGAEAKLLNKQIFETIYFGALEASCELAMEEGTYSTYKGSPVERGLLQYDMWGVEPTGLWDWAALKAKIAQFGVRNSLLLAPMPTASTAQILGNNESIEPYTSNIYSRRVLSGDFQVVNPHLMKDLIDLNLWDDQMRQRLISESGSVQNIPQLPEKIKELYKTVWEIPQREVLHMAADRAAFIDQSQSLNLHIAEPTYAKLTSMHFYAWQLGLKTGMYYLRTRPAVDAIKFTVNKQTLKEAEMMDLEQKENMGPEPLKNSTNKLNQQTPEQPECLMCSG